MNAFPASEFARLVFPVGQPGVFLMLRAYFDDSGTHRDSEVVVWGGVIGRAEWFDAFEKVWQEMLDNPLPGPKLQKFSLGDCANAVGEFETYKPAERDALRFRAREIIAQSTLKPVAFCVPVGLWNKLLPARVRRAYGGPDSVAFASCADLALGVSAKQGGVPLACVFDKGQQSRILDLHIEDAEKRAGERGIPISYTFGAVKDHLGLQAADTVATQHYWQGLEFARGGGEPNDPHYLSMVRHMSPTGLVLGVSNLLQLKREFLKKCPPGKWVIRTPRNKRLDYE